MEVVTDEVWVVMVCGTVMIVMISGEVVMAGLGVVMVVP